MTTNSEPNGLPDRKAMLALAALAYNSALAQGNYDLGFGKVYEPRGFQPDGYFWRYVSNDCLWNPLGEHPADIASRYVLAMAVKLNIDNADCCVWKRLALGELVQVWWGGDTGVTSTEAIVYAAYLVGKKQCLS